MKKFAILASVVLLFTFLGAAQTQSTSAAPNSTSAPKSAMPEWQKAAGGHLEFDVASVKQSESASAGSRVMPSSNVPLSPGDAFSPTGGLFQAAHWPLIVYITFAYKLSPGELQPLTQELPKWALTGFFDIDARASGNPTKDQFRLMMQSLLAHRFKLALHTETRAGPVYALLLDKPGKFGPQLQPHTADSPACPPSGGELPIATSTVAEGFPSQCGSIVFMPSSKPGRIGFGARDVGMDLIAGAISGAGKFIGDLGRPVIDGTGLSGTYDFVIEFAPDLPLGMKAPGGDAADSGPTFLEALKEQLGLKLEPQTGEVRQIVIDHIEQPTPN
ncbi:MAG TPA: TIGR03435 family protein [Candidatus Aquilonibacter sp.]|nr:TIGR03435 family protein [Candidatus Aquilonibacter sp.]